MKIISSTILSLFVLLLISCDREVVTQLDTTGTEGKANLKIVHASPYLINYNVQLKVNDERISNNITNATPFPGGGLNTGGSSWPLYMAVNPGNNKITLSVPKAGSNADSIMLYNTNITVEANKYYSAYVTDTGANTQTVLVAENLAAPDDNTSRYKFVNLIPNQPALDLYIGANKVASNIPYKGVSPEFVLARASAGQLQIRPANAAPTSAALAVYPAGTASYTVPNKRVMTIFARGYSGGTGNRIAAISLLYNK